MNTKNTPVIIGAVLVVTIAIVLGFVARSGKFGGAGNQAGAVKVLAAESFWGDIATKLGGDRVQVTSIINNPETDPHDYEPTAKDSRAVAGAHYVIINGIGYDPWADKLLAASKNSAKTLIIGDFVGLAPGANPHQWYNPANVVGVMGRINQDLKTLKPEAAGYFDQQLKAYYEVELKQYNALITNIQTTYANTPVGASESIFTPMAKVLQLSLVTPSSFLNAISEGEEPTAADKALTDQQITGKQIKVYVYNSQNSTPDVARQVEKAKAAGVPVVTITETPPIGVSFADWQTGQLKNLRDALAMATGR